MTHLPLTEGAFTAAEFAERLHRTRREMAARGLAALLVVSPENVYYLAGLNHLGYFAFTLLVVPPQTSSQNAHETLMSAGHRGNTDDVEALLTSRRFARRIGGRDAAAEDEAESAQQRWELDGGPLYAP